MYSTPCSQRDLKASNRLIDDKYEVLLGILSKTCIQRDNSPSNKIIRLLQLPNRTSEEGVRATYAYNVYCFGNVLMKLVTGKIGISASSDSTTKKPSRRLVTNIMDRRLIVDEDFLKEVWVMTVVAKSCFIINLLEDLS